MSPARVTRRRRGKRRATRRRKPEVPTPSPGERVWVLDVPYGVRVPGTTWHRGLGMLWQGPRLPEELRSYDSMPYSVERFIENQLNATPRPSRPNSPPMTPRPIQIEGARAIARHAAAGGEQFLLADEPGVGKTLSCVVGAKAAARLRGARRVLVIADRPAAITIGHWRRTIAGVGDGGLEWVITTWDRLPRVASYRWDIVIADEAHMVRHTTTKRWRAFSQIAGYTRTTGQRPYLLCATATPSHTPLEQPYLSAAFAHQLGGSAKEWANEFPSHLRRHGVHVHKGRWTEDPRRRAEDLTRVRQWLTDSSPPALLYRPAPWGSCQITGLPVELSVAERLAYEADWAEFCAEMELARRGRDASKGRSAVLRFRQKSGLIRVSATVEWVQAKVEAGQQVAVSCEFVTTAADPIVDALSAAGIPAARIYGGDSRFDVEEERLTFQRGEVPVVVFTPTASLSLHAGEVLPDGRRGSSARRVGLFHQARYSGIQGRQVTGRTHRDHQRCDWYVAYSEDTVEEKVARVMIERYAATGEAVGGDTTAVADIASMLGADWLPSSTWET